MHRCPGVSPVSELTEGATIFRSFTLVELGFLVDAARWTVLLSLIAFAGGGMVGLLIMILRTSTSRIFSSVAIVYIAVFQGTPLLSQLLVMYFGLGLFGLDVNPWLAATVALTLNSSAFLGEIWRGSIQAIPKPQWEASSSLCLTFLQQLRYVIVPQALRLATPPTVGYFVQIIKGTSLASVIGFVELTRAAQILNAATFRPFLAYFCVGAIYFALCYPLTALSRRLERRLHVAR
jgi:polar amino acid transport system permease protein